MPNQVSKNVSLTAELDAFIGQEVASGRFQNASEVVRAALRMMADHEMRLVPRGRRSLTAKTSRLLAPEGADNQKPGAS